METQYSRNFPKSMKAILRSLLIIRESQMAYSTKNGLNSIELLAKGVPWKSPNKPRLFLRQWAGLLSTN